MQSGLDFKNLKTSTQIQTNTPPKACPKRVTTPNNKNVFSFEIFSNFEATKQRVRIKTNSTINQENMIRHWPIQCSNKGGQGLNILTKIM